MAKEEVSPKLPAGGGLAVAVGIAVGAPTAAAMDSDEEESRSQPTTSASVNAWITLVSVVVPAVQLKETVVGPEVTPRKVIVPNLPIPEKEAVVSSIDPDRVMFPRVSKIEAWLTGFFLLWGLPADWMRLL